MNIVFASDHAGFALKEVLVAYVKDELSCSVEDLGAHALEESDDYPTLIARAAKVVSEHPESTKAIILGGSGQGEAIVANRFPRVRAVVFNGQYRPNDGRTVPDEIRVSREHNNANVLSLGARFLNESEAKEAVRVWLETPFGEEERHKRRIEQIESYPN